ncbi:MAG: glycosyltransferase [Acidobacteriota bacterium]|nr:glycosyltransferase [Acidobacteriota bacterium]
MKIVHIVSTADGAPWMVALAREQKRLGHDVAVIVPSLNGRIATALKRDSIPCYAAATDIVFEQASLFRKLRRLTHLVLLLRRIRPDVVHSHIIGSVLTARIASWIADVPNHFAGNVHPISLESDLLRQLEVGTAFCDTKTIASSTYTRELYLQHGIPANQLAMVYYAVDQDAHDPALADGAAVRRELGLASHTPVVGKIAYFYPPSRTGYAVPANLRGRGLKGHDVLLRAIPYVLEQISDAKFVLVGRGSGPLGPQYEQELKSLAESLGVSYAVLFPGERTDVANVLASFDVSVHCSLSDNLGGTVESLLMERPMVVSDAKGFADTIVHEETGLVVPKDEPRALADAILRLLRDRDLARRLGKQGRDRMLAGFTLAHNVAGIEALLAATTERAANHYRLRRTFARIVTTPFRLLPMMLRMRRIMRDAI